MSKLSLCLSLFLFSSSAWSQQEPVIVPDYARIPMDSLRKQQMVTSLNGLLSQLAGTNKDNAYVQAEYLPETSDLLDEIRGMGNPLPGRKDPCLCYLTNVNPL